MYLTDSEVLKNYVAYPVTVIILANFITLISHMKQAYCKMRNFGIPHGILNACCSLYKKDFIAIISMPEQWIYMLLTLMNPTVVVVLMLSIASQGSFSCGHRSH